MLLGGNNVPNFCLVDRICVRVVRTMQIFVCQCNRAIRCVELVYQCIQAYSNKKNLGGIIIVLLDQNDNNSLRHVGDPEQNCHNWSVEEQGSIYIVIVFEVLL